MATANRTGLREQLEKLRDTVDETNKAVAETNKHVAVLAEKAHPVAELGYWSVLISWPAIAVALGFSVGLGVLFGSYPAHRASQLDPIVALRAE